MHSPWQTKVFHPQYSMLLLGPRPPSRSLRASPSAAGFRSSSTLDNSELMNFWRNGRGRRSFESLLIPKCWWQRLPVCWSVASPMILDWNYGEPATLLKQDCTATRKLLIGQTVGWIC
jgi:hypothetical protein